MFADETVRVANSDEQLQCFVTKFGRLCEGIKLRVSMENRELMVGERKRVVPQVKFEMNWENISS